MPCEREDVIRSLAWAKLGVPLNPGSVLYQYAKAHDLGAPLTTEFTIAGYVCQGYQNGITYVRHGDWGNVAVMPWL